MIDNTGMFEHWVASLNPKYVEIWQLEGKGNLGVFMVKDKTPDDYPIAKVPTFHVWKGDDWLFCGQNPGAAYMVYNKNLLTMESSRKGVC